MVNNSRVGFLIVSVEGEIYRLYRSEILEGQSDRVGTAIDVVLTDRTDLFGKRKISNRDTLYA